LKMNKYLLCLILCLGLKTLYASERMYLDPKEVSGKGTSFHIHVGNNIWLTTDTIHRDSTGMYTMEKNLMRSQGTGAKSGYIRQWRCPYCYMYWPVGEKCQNGECPSKY
jgi:hypothetical protein